MLTIDSFDKNKMNFESNLFQITIIFKRIRINLESHLNTLHWVYLESALANALFEPLRDLINKYTSL